MSVLLNKIKICLAGVALLVLLGSVCAQTQPPPMHEPVSASVSKYLDQVQGKTANELVDLALTNNADLAAMRKEAEAAEAMIRQARLRPNPGIEARGTRQINGMDNSLMVEGSLPLELGGRRNARIRVAERELDVRRAAVAEQERQLAFDVRSKFGESLAAALKLKLLEEMLGSAIENIELVTAQVTEGRRPPLDESMQTVELNRLRALRETSEATLQIRMLELRNLVGMAPEEPLKLRGDFENLVASLPPQNIATEQALQSRPDLLGARAVEQLAAARVEQARTEGRVDADVMAGYQRMRSGFPLLGIEPDTGALLPIDTKMHFFTFGVKLNLPTRNRNQGAIESAILEQAAARNRREFGELTIRREVAAAYARYNGAARAMEIYRVGVRDQAAANLDVVRQTYELGSKTLLDYIAEHHRFIDVENGYIDAMFETYLARLEILRATNAPELENK